MYLLYVAYATYFSSLSLVGPILLLLEIIIVSGFLSKRDKLVNGTRGPIVVRLKQRRVTEKNYPNICIYI